LSARLATFVTKENPGDSSSVYDISCDVRELEADLLRRNGEIMVDG
jgi:hypothetical protein